MTYEWPPRKSAANGHKHRLEFEEAEVSLDPLALTFPDSAAVNRALRLIADAMPAITPAKRRVRLR